MHRRDLFNILFKSNSTDALIVQEPDPVLKTPSYLMMNETEHFCQEWKELPGEGFFNMGHLFEYAFTLRLAVKYSSPVIFSGEGKSIFDLQMGVEDDSGTGQGKKRITLGLNASGNLFINDQQSERFLESEKLVEGIQLILEVNPQIGNRTHAKIKILDQYGLTLCVLKSTAYSLSDWKGNVTADFNSRLCFDLLRVEGSRTK